MIRNLILALMAIMMTTTVISFQPPDDIMRGLTRRLRGYSASQQRRSATGSRTRSLFPDSDERFGFGTSDRSARDPEDTAFVEVPQEDSNQLMFDLSAKINTVIRLVENSFEKTFERIGSLENRMQTMEKTLIQLTQSHVHHQEEASSSSWSDGANQSSLLKKMYNIHQQTYQVCKDAIGGGAAVGWTQPSGASCPTVDRICSLVRLYKETHPEQHKRVADDSNHRHQYGSNLDISAGNEGAARAPPNKRATAEPETETQNQDDDGEAIAEVLGTVANWTLDQYVTRIHRKVAEELNVFTFKLMEQLQKHIDQLGKVDAVLKSNDQITYSVLEMRDLLTEDHGTLAKLWQQSQQGGGRQPPPSDGQCQHHHQTEKPGNETQLHHHQQQQIKTMLNEYYEKLTQFIQNNTATRKSSRKRNESPGPVTVVVHNTETISTEKDRTLKSITNTDPMIAGRPAFEPITRTQEQRSQCSRDATAVYPRSCNELRLTGATCNGVYVILTPGASSMRHVYCDMDPNTGTGWTVILRRGKFPGTKYLLSFDQDFNHFRDGFGDIHTSEFWIGLDFVHRATAETAHLLQIDLMDNDNNFVSLVYHGFRVGPLDDGYRFYVDGIQTDMLRGSDPSWNLTEVATGLLDRNRTRFATANHVNHPNGETLNGKQQNFLRECAFWFRSGWWYSMTEPEPQRANTNNHHQSQKAWIEMCQRLNRVHLMAPIGQPSTVRAVQLSARWPNWPNGDRYEDGTTNLRYLMMKIRSASAA